MLWDIENCLCPSRNLTGTLEVPLVLPNLQSSCVPVERPGPECDDTIFGGQGLSPVALRVVLEVEQTECRSVTPEDLT